MALMCPAEDSECSLPNAAPGAPLEPAHARLVSEGASGLLAWACASDIGAGRENNEDFVGTCIPGDGEPPLFVVADGMGGHAAGEVASRLAVETALSWWQSAGSVPAPQRIRAAARSANVAVFDAGQDAQRRGMGSTFTALTLAGREVAIAHVGDSRAYLVRDGQASQLTADHSRVGEMLRMRMITAEQAAKHPARSMLTRSLGAEPMVQIDLVRQPAEVGDIYVLCSDGLWDSVARTEIADAVCGAAGGEIPPPAQAVAGLIELALKRDAPDNISILVIRLLAHAQPPAPRRLFRRRGA